MGEKNSVLLPLFLSFHIPFTRLCFQLSESPPSSSARPAGSFCEVSWDFDAEVEFCVVRSDDWDRFRTNGSKYADACFDRASGPSLHSHTLSSLRPAGSYSFTADTSAAYYFAATNENPRAEPAGEVGWDLALATVNFSAAIGSCSLLGNRTCTFGAFSIVVKYSPFHFVELT